MVINLLVPDLIIGSIIIGTFLSFLLLIIFKTCLEQLIVGSKPIFTTSILNSFIIALKLFVM